MKSGNNSSPSNLQLSANRVNSIQISYRKDLLDSTLPPKRVRRGLQCDSGRRFYLQARASAGWGRLGPVADLGHCTQFLIQCGHDMYRSMTSSFYRGACGALLIFGINNRKSFQQVKTWYRQFRQEGSPHAFIFLVGTKVDEEGDRKVSPQQAMEMMKEIKGAFYIETSARSGAQVQ